MKLRLLDGLLIIAIGVGGVLAWRTGRERSRLAERYARLTRVTGDLVVRDPSKIYIQALDTGQPLHFAWRVYCPMNYTQVWSERGMTSGSSWSSSPSEIIARVRIRRNPKGDLDVYAHYGGGSSQTTLATRGWARLLYDHRNEIQVEQLGNPVAVEITPGGTVSVLRLSVPENLQAEARKLLAPDEQKVALPVFFELTLGPTADSP